MIIKSFLKSGVRNFLVDKVSSSINILGLASTVAIGLAVYVIIDRQLSLDHFHPDHERIFTVQSVINWDGAEQTWARAPQQLGAVFSNDFPQVEHMTRIQRKAAIIRHGDAVFYERLTFADIDFFKVFNFPISTGNENALQEKNNIVLSADQVEKYFNKQDPIGKDIRVIINDKVHLFTVAAVAEEFPKTASFKFDFLLSMDNLPSLFGTDLNTWKEVNKSSVFTFIKMESVESLEVIEKNTRKYLEVINQANPDWLIKAFSFEPLTTIAQKSQYTRECIACGSTPEVLVIFAIISVILFVSACFNYINISIAASSRRLKEIALRKVIGSSRQKIIIQFMTENIVFSFAAIALGILLAKTVVIPGMNDIFGGDNLALDFLNNTGLIGFVFALFIILGISSGAYPAWYISSFKSIDIFRGKERLVGKNRITKIFLTLQFFLTFIAIVSGLIFTQTNTSQAQRDWGYDEENLLVVPINSTTQFRELDQFSRQSGQVTNHSGSQSQIGRSNTSQVVEMQGIKSAVDVLLVDYGYLETMGLRLNSGRFFDPNLVSDSENAVIVNRMFLKKFGWWDDDATTEKIKIDDQVYSIIGVVEDFHHDDFFEPITASIFRLTPEEEFRYFTMKIEDGRTGDVESGVEALWKEKFADVPYTGYFQSEVFDRFFENTGMLIDVMNFTAIMAIILSSMGLFGLVSLLIVKRMKELSIRNVLGATRLDALKLLTGQFTWILSVAIIFAVPVSYLLFQELLSQMFLGTPTEMSPIPFVVTLAILIVTILIPIYYHLRRILSVNPVEHLRME